MKDGRVKVRLMHAQDARFVFVRIMGQFWLRTDACVAFVPCPTCKAATGDPCTGSGEGPRTETHYLRRRAAVRHLTGVAQRPNAKKTEEIGNAYARARAKKEGLLRPPTAEWASVFTGLDEWVDAVKKSATQEPAEAYVAIMDHFGPWTIGWCIARADTPERYTLTASLTNREGTITIDDWLILERIAKAFGAPMIDVEKIPDDHASEVTWSWPAETPD